ncbi:MAG: hypothetical protein WC480_01520 [Patescibacteria group bacterium]
MVKTIKILLIITGLVLLVGLGSYFYFFYTYQSSGPTDRAQSVPNGATPSQEVYQQYFTELSIPKTDLVNEEDYMLIWQLTEDAPDTTLYVLRVVDKNKGIFIAETQPHALVGYDGSIFPKPADPGDYELWFYVINENGTEYLASVLPFTAQ